MLPARELGRLIQAELKRLPGLERVVDVVVVRASPEVRWIAYAIDGDGRCLARLECERIASRLRETFDVMEERGATALQLPRIERSRREHRSRAEIEGLILQDIRRRPLPKPVTAVTVIRGSAGWHAYGAGPSDSLFAIPSAAPIIEAMVARYTID